MRQLAGDLPARWRGCGGHPPCLRRARKRVAGRAPAAYVDRLNLLNRLIPSDFTAIQRVYTAWSAKEKIGLLERLRRGNKEGIVLKLLTARTPRAKRQDRRPAQVQVVRERQLRGHARASHQAQRLPGPVCHGADRRSGQRHHPAQPRRSRRQERWWRCVTSTRSARAAACTSPCYLGEREDIEPAECTTNQLKYRHEAPVTIRV